MSGGGGGPAGAPGRKPAPLRPAVAPAAPAAAIPGARGRRSPRKGPLTGLARAGGGARGLAGPPSPCPAWGSGCRGRIGGRQPRLRPRPPMTFEPSASCGLGPPPHLGQARKGRGRLQGAAAGRLALQAAGRWLGCLRSLGCHFTGCRPVIAPRRTYGCWAGRCGAGAARAAVLARAARGGGWGPAARLLMVGGGLRGADLGPQCACGPRQRVVDAVSCRPAQQGSPHSPAPSPAPNSCQQAGTCRLPATALPGPLPGQPGRAPALARPQPPLPAAPHARAISTRPKPERQPQPSRQQHTGVAAGDGGEGPPPPCFLVQLAARGLRPWASNPLCSH